MIGVIENRENPMFHGKFLIRRGEQNMAWHRETWLGGKSPHSHGFSH